MDGVPLHIVKKTNATFGHYGEMSGTRTWGMARDRVQRRPRDAEAAARSIPYPHGTPTHPIPPQYPNPEAAARSAERLPAVA